MRPLFHALLCPIVLLLLAGCTSLGNSDEAALKRTDNRASGVDFSRLILGGVSC